MSKIYTFLIVLSPILSIYRSPISAMDLGTFSFLAMSPIIFINFLKNDKVKTPFFMILLIVYIFCGSLVSYLTNESTDIILHFLRMAKFIVLLIIVFIMGNDLLFDYNLAKKILKSITIIAVSYIIIQTITFYFTGKILPSVYFNFVKYELYATIDYAHAATRFYRPTSFFLEPAHFSQYVILTLAYSLFGDYQSEKGDFKLAIFITIGLLLSTSGQGLILGIILWSLWWLDNIRKANFKKFVCLIVLIVILLILIVPLISKFSIVQKTVSRFTNEDGSLGPAITGRLFKYTYYNELEPYQKVIGVGYGNVPAGVYLNSVAYTLYTSGILGIFIVLMMLLDAFNNVEGFQKYFCLIYILMILGSESFTAIGIIYYFTFIYSGYKKETPKAYIK